MEQSFSIILREVPMKTVTVELEPAVVLFYARIAAAANVPLEQVLHDALFKLAGELSLEALKENNFGKPL